MDAFVALGGQPNKEGKISKSTLINIIKLEFELTIDMEEYLMKIGGDHDQINYYQFCVLLDAGTSGNPSRVSSYISQNKSTSFMRFSYFVNNIYWNNKTYIILTINPKPSPVPTLTTQTPYPLELKTYPSHQPSTLEWPPLVFKLVHSIWQLLILLILILSHMLVVVGGC